MMLSILEILVDITAILLLLIGFVNEERFIKVEENIRRIIVGNYRRVKRQWAAKKAARKERKV